MPTRCSTTRNKYQREKKDLHTQALVCVMNVCVSVVPNAPLRVRLLGLVALAGADRFRFILFDGDTFEL